MKYRFIGLGWTGGVGQLTGRADSAGQAGSAPLELTSSSPTQISVFCIRLYPHPICSGRVLSHHLPWTLVHWFGKSQDSYLHKRSECRIFACTDCDLTIADLDRHHCIFLDFLEFLFPANTSFPQSPGANRHAQLLLSPLALVT
jgi:hypothetical protein